MSDFNPQRARAKRPCPLWVDAFQRDTQHLEADEVGAYMLILMAMWTRETCDFPNDPTRLARVSRVSSRLWKSRIGPVLMPLFTTDGGAVFSKRLRIEAAFVEKFCQSQSERKSGSDIKSDPLAKPQGVHNASQKDDENSDNSLKNKNQPSTTDISTDDPPYYPTQQPNNPTVKVGGDAGVREGLTHREKLIEAMGADPESPIVSTGGKTIGGRADMSEADRWRQLGISDEDQIAVVREVMARKRDGPPMSFKFFTQAMQRFAASANQPPLIPSAGDSHDERTTPNSQRQLRIIQAAALGASADPWG